MCGLLHSLFEQKPYYNTSIETLLFLPGVVLPHVFSMFFFPGYDGLLANITCKHDWIRLSPAGCLELKMLLLSIGEY